MKTARQLYQQAYRNRRTGEADHEDIPYNIRVAANTSYLTRCTGNIQQSWISFKRGYAFRTRVKAYMRKQS